MFKIMLKRKIKELENHNKDLAADVEYYRGKLKECNEAWKKSVEDKMKLRGELDTLKKWFQDVSEQHENLEKEYKDVSEQHENLKKAYILKNNNLVELMVQSRYDRLIEEIKGEKKMTNFEYYKDDILKISKEGGVGISDGKPINCLEISCTKCDLYRDACRRDIFNWLYAEHVEKPKLTKKERMFCELMGTGYITRDGDRNNLIFWWKNKPFKSKHLGDYWLIDPSDKKFTCISDKFEHLKFDFIKWDDKEPWKVEDLLKLEVEE